MSDKTTPETFEECQNTHCIECTEYTKIPEVARRHDGYFMYCPTRKKLDTEGNKP